MSKVAMDLGPIVFTGPIVQTIKAHWPGGRGIFSDGFVDSSGTGTVSLTVVVQSSDSGWSTTALSLGGPAGELADQGDLLVDLPESDLTFTMTLSSGSFVQASFVLLQID